MTPMMPGHLVGMNHRVGCYLLRAKKHGGLTGMSAQNDLEGVMACVTAGSLQVHPAVRESHA